MIVTVCGAYRNAGDHLIGARARALLSEFVEKDIVVVDRKSITPDHYDVFNKARAVLLTGGPAYQAGMYPTIYDIDLAKIATPVIPFGLGWKTSVKGTADTFKFKPEALEFITKVHEKIEFSSARDPLTVDVIKKQGIDNILMTGCPAWYDMRFFENKYQFQPEIKTLVLSMPAKMQPGVHDLMAWLTRRFPKARRIASFHHGLVPAPGKVGRERAIDFMKFSAKAMMKGWKIASLAGSLDKLEELYGSADLHLGYRVHAHLFCLSRRKSSILINEDIRGVGQATALGAPIVNVDSKGDIAPIQDVVESHFQNNGEIIARSVETMRETFPTMKHFLSSI
jgi:hypothetical protein